MMILIAAVALAIVYLVPMIQGMVWQYRHPGSVHMFSVTIGTRPFWWDLDPPSKAVPTFEVGKPLLRVVEAKAEPSDLFPAGLIYRAELRVSVTDPVTFTTCYETQQQTRRIITGAPSPQDPLKSLPCPGSHAAAIFEVTSKQPGNFAIRYEQTIVDLFGRRTAGALSTEFLTVK